MGGIKKEVRHTDKGYFVKYKGTKGQTYYGSASANKTPFFDFNVVDNIKRTAKNLGWKSK